MEKEIDDLGLLEVLLAGEGERVDAEQALVVRRPDMALELGDETRAPGPGLLELAQALVQQLFIDRGDHGPTPICFTIPFGGRRREGANGDLHICSCKQFQ